MSAWVCTHHHIAALVGSFLAMKDRYTEVEDPRALAKMLHFENMRSVDHRYRDNAEALAEFTAYYASHAITSRQIEAWQAKPLTPGQFFKALDCYEYQSCECDDWRQTEAYKLCKKMRGQVCARVEGYESTPWGIDYPPPAGHMSQYIVSALRDGRTLREDVFDSPSMETALACAKDAWAYLGPVSWLAVSGEDNPARVARIRVLP